MVRDKVLGLIVFCTALSKYQKVGELSFLARQMKI